MQVETWEDKFALDILFNECNDSNLMKETINFLYENDQHLRHKVQMSKEQIGESQQHYYLILDYTYQISTKLDNWKDLKEFLYLCKNTTWENVSNK